MKRVIEAILCIFIGVFLFGIFAITFQVIGEDSPNKASIIGGILSMLGGAIGAFGAYFVARLQMTKQLELQYKKEREKMILEIKINKYHELLIIYDNILQILNSMGMTLLDNISLMLAPNISMEDVRKYEKNIRIHIIDIRMNIPKINAYMSYFEEEDIKNIPDFKKVMKEFEDEIYALIITAVENEYSYDSIEEDDLLFKTFDERIEEVLDIPYGDVVRMVYLIQQKIDKIIKS